MKIIVDAFGGDHSPDEVIKGAAMAVEKLGVDIVLTGDENRIKSFAAANNISLDRISIKHTAYFYFKGTRRLFNGCRT